MAEGGTVTIRGGPEIVKALAKIDQKVTGGLARGAIGEGANVIRDLARTNAVQAGLLERGSHQSAKGNTYQRRGQIPLSIIARVRKKAKRGLTTGIVGIDVAISEAGRGGVNMSKTGAPSIINTKKTQAPHWVMVEFGSINNPPMPFLRPALLNGADRAVAAIIDVLSRGIARYNVPGG